jgi:hypothetical protein
MTATVTTISDLIVTHLVALASVESATVGNPEGSIGDEKLPHVLVGWRSRGYSFDVGRQIDMDLTLVLLINGDSFDSVNQVIEDVQKLWWSDSANYAALVAAGVDKIIPTDFTLPVQEEGGREFSGSLTFAVTIRYTIT